MIPCSSSSLNDARNGLADLGIKLQTEKKSDLTIDQLKKIADNIVVDKNNLPALLLNWKQMEGIFEKENLLKGKSG